MGRTLWGTWPSTPPRGSSHIVGGAWGLQLRPGGEGGGVGVEGLEAGVI